MRALILIAVLAAGLAYAGPLKLAVVYGHNGGTQSRPALRFAQNDASRVADPRLYMRLAAKVLRNVVAAVTTVASNVNMGLSGGVATTIARSGCWQRQCLGFSESCLLSIVLSIEHLG